MKRRSVCLMEIGEIDSMLFGNFVDHLGRCTYCGIFEPGSALSDVNGFQLFNYSVIQLLKFNFL